MSSGPRKLALAASAALLASAIVAHADKVERVEISGPILPTIDVLYPYESSNYPTTATEQAQAAHEASLTFPFLLQECSAKYPDIKVRGPGDPPLTPAELNANYQLIATCAYLDYSAKPYWIPQFVDDVDICGNELGSGWRLITEADIASFKEADFQFIAKTLTGNKGALYFSLHVFARAADGTLKLGDLTPGVTTRIQPIPVKDGETTKQHLESDMSLRCIRRTMQ